MSDFHSRLRLSVPKDQLSSRSLGYGAQDFARALHKYARRMPLSTSQAEAFLSIMRGFGYSVGETLKAQKSRHRKAIAAIRASSEPLLERSRAATRIAEGIEETAASISTVQEMLRAPEFSRLPYVSLLAEYIFHLYVQYLGGVDAAVKQAGMSNEPGWVALTRVIEVRVAEAAGHPIQSFHNRSLLDDERKREEHMLRISQLKKFFHGGMFVDVSTEQVIKKFTEPVAAAAAGVAAMWATAFQQLQPPSYIRFGLGSISFLSLGVAAYILKDRLKDRSRAFITKKAAKFLPDVEQNLVANNTSIGRVREWFCTRALSAVPDEIQGVRTLFHLSEAERHLPEDILHYSKHVTVTGGSGGRFGIQDNLRINLERYLKYLDDPYKNMTLLDPLGHIAQLSAHRVYHFYLIARVGMQLSKTPSGAEPRLRAFRVVMDKNGIQRVDKLQASAPFISQVPVKAKSRWWGLRPLQSQRLIASLRRLVPAL